MNDLIDRQAAIDATWFEPSYTDPLNVLTEARDRLKVLPSAQPEIIRCKDCRRYGRDDCFMKVQMLWELKPDDFCSYAERKDVET